VLASVVVTTVVVVQSRRPPDTIIGSQPSPATSSAATALDVPRSPTALGNNVLLWPREVQANWDIWSITVDGVDSKRLTAGLGADTRPVLSADRRSFIYHHEPATPGGGASPSSADVDGLHVVGVDGSGDRLLFPTGPAASLDLARPGWSPDGQLIASASRKPGEPAELVLVSITGDRVRTIATAPKLDDPTFTPDGTFVTYWASEPTDLNGGTLMMVPTDGGSGPRVFLPGRPGQDADPAWSPDGSQLTFRRRGTGGHNIWVVNRDGSGLTQLTTAPGDDQDPSWSPDGRRIAFKSARNGEPEIFVMNADGSNQHLVLHNPEADDAPAWTRR
jgi:Tol biopolymer transport system component